MGLKFQLNPDINHCKIVLITVDSPGSSGVILYCPKQAGTRHESPGFRIVLNEALPTLIC